MKIYDSYLGGAAATGAQRTQETQQTERSGGRSAASGDGGDRVEFSGSLGQLARVLSSDGSGRAARVQALAAQYQSGAYRPDSAATSRAMITEALSAGAGTPAELG